MNGATIADDVARARALGITLRVTENADRVNGRPDAIIPASWRPVEDRPATRDPRGPNACPTCDDGIRTIETPARCRACVKGGL